MLVVSIADSEIPYYLVLFKNMFNQPINSVPDRFYVAIVGKTIEYIGSYANMI